MTTQVLDLTTIAHALNILGDDFLNNPEWHGFTDAQHEFLDWYRAHGDEIRKLDGLDALASLDADALNAFLISRGFKPMFEPFDGIGVASVLDMLVNWAKAGGVTSLSRLEPGTERDTFGRRKDTWVRYPAFEIEPEGVQIFQVAGFVEPLVQLHTVTGHSLWLMKSPAPEHGISLVRLAQKVLTGAERRISTDYAHTLGVIVPMLDFDLQADLNWLLGLLAQGSAEEFYVDQAVQQFKLRANEQGARVKVATGIVVATAACGPSVTPYTFDEPFLGFFTQPGHDTLPLAAFWADTDSWKTPAGTLEEL